MVTGLARFLMRALAAVMVAVAGVMMQFRCPWLQPHNTPEDAGDFDSDLAARRVTKADGG